MSQRYIGGVVTETTNVAQSPWTGEWTQQAALQGFAGAQAPLKVANSLRFRSSASAYLSRTPSVAGNQRTWTWSGWVKRGTLGAYQAIFQAGDGASSVYTVCWFNSSDQLALLQDNGSGGVLTVTTNAVFRDPSAWYHIVIVVDTTQATSNNRTIFYVNGVNQSLTYALQLAQNATTWINSTTYPFRIGSRTNGASFIDGYLTEINFIDGQALPPTAFGTFSKENGVWSPIAYTGTYGTNGFKLNFSNGTSTTTLGYDSSGNGNNWTTNNISLTAGSTYDWMIDSPTKFPGSSYGVGNYAVANPLDKGSDITASDGNLSISWGGVNGHSIRDSIAMSAGQWYCELTMGTSSVTMGLIAQNISGVGSSSGWPGSSTFGVSGSYGYANNGNKYTNSTSTAYGASYTTGDVIGIAFDATAGTLTFYKNGSSQGTAFTGISGAYCFAIGYFGGSTGGTPAYANFGQRPFAYTPPSGYKSLCTQNLPGVTIQNGAQYMAATTYTGSGGSMAVSNAVNGVGFQPDYVWIKSRSNPRDHRNMDSVRGINNVLSSNLTNAEYAGSALSALIATGFTLNTSDQQNNSGETYIAWQWKAGGTAVTNTDGTITSTVSANQTAGFSVVTYTGNGNLSATVGHGLSVVPAMIIDKGRSDGTYSWRVYHQSITAGNMLLLNSTSAAITINSDGGISSVGASTFGFAGGTPAVNATSTTYVAYCFAAIPGYSAFGSYTGNGSADGPFVYCGFRPRWVLIKNTSGANVWVIYDTARDSYNVAGKELYPNLSNAEYSSTSLDITSNGFKIRSTSGGLNASSNTYIYAAFAENPFQNALAR